jgi:hypothetical protein
MYAHTQTFLSKNHGRSIVRIAPPTSSRKGLYFHFALGIRSRTLAHMLDSLVRVSRRVDERHFVPVLLTHDRTNLFPRVKRSGTNPKYKYSRPYTASHRFLFSNFRYFFHSLFKVLFIFPSRYLFAIGLLPIFSFRWNLPPD